MKAVRHFFHNIYTVVFAAALVAIFGLVSISAAQANGSAVINSALVIRAGLAAVISFSLLGIHNWVAHLENDKF